MVAMTELSFIIAVECRGRFSEYLFFPTSPTLALKRESPHSCGVLSTINNLSLENNKKKSSRNHWNDVNFVVVVVFFTFIESCVMSTGVIRLRADKRCKRSRACCSTAMTNASWTVLQSSSAVWMDEKAEILFCLKLLFSALLNWNEKHSRREIKYKYFHSDSMHSHTHTISLSSKLISVGKTLTRFFFYRITE